VKDLTPSEAVVVVDLVAALRTTLALPEAGPVRRVVGTREGASARVVTVEGQEFAWRDDPITTLPLDLAASLAVLADLAQSARTTNP
jgi:hypothetical protein